MAAHPQFSPRIPPELARLAKLKAAHDDLNLGEYIAKLIEADTREFKEQLAKAGLQAG